MKKLGRILVCCFGLLLLTGCGEKKLNLNEEVELKGKVTVKDLGDSKKITILNLDEPILVDGEKIYEVEIDYDKELKDNKDLTVKGKVTKDKKDYSFVVSEVDDILSYINTFSTEDFIMTIPSDLIKISTIKRIDNGFILYSSRNLDVGGEVFKVYAIDAKDYDLYKDDKIVERVTSNKDKVVLIEYPTSNEYDEDGAKEYEEIASNITIIKNNIRLK